MEPLHIKPFQSAVGPTIEIPDRPEDVFQLFFDQILQADIVKQSNKYAGDAIGEEANQKWNPITAEELRAFFGFSILWVSTICHPSTTIGVRPVLPVRCNGEQDIEAEIP